VQPYPVLNSRQKELLRTLLIAGRPVSYKELSEMFKLSTRTIQREMNSLKSILDNYQLKIGKKIGAGLELKGSTEGKEKLRELVEQAKTLSAYSPEERQEGISYDLLLSKEPVKQFVFSKKYGVTEATVSYDLDKVSVWLDKGGVKLVRSPGIGVYIDGTEQQRRTLLSRLLHKDITFEEWLELFHGKKEEEALQGKLGVVIRNRLLKFVQTDKILDVERVVYQVLHEQSEIELTDRNYVNLIVHLMLALERIQGGELIEKTKIIQGEVVDTDIYSLAERIVLQLEDVLAITIPKIEVSYIALHLAGARLSKGQKVMNEDSEEFTWIELTQSFIRATEYYLKESFAGDELFSEGLVSHFAPAFNRLKYGLQIHNPMLEKIQERYPDIFAACQKACELLSEKTGYVIPDDEVGYLAMHIGAALIRKQDLLKKKYKAIVVCASGLGTSTYLASRIRTEMPNVNVEAVISMNRLEGWLNEKVATDIVISTVNLPNVNNDNVVIVSPFLKQEDLARIQIALAKVGEQQLPQQSEQKPIVQQSTSLVSLAKFGEGMMQILRNLQIYHHVEATTPLVLANILSRIKGVGVVTDFEILLDDLKKREQQGGFVLGDLAMIHTKTEGVNNLLVVIFRMKEPVLWHSDDEEEQSIQTALLLAAPKNAPKEHIEMISEISAMFVDESFVNILSEATADVVKASLEDVLSKAYEVKAVRALKEFQGK
jgi:mannitol operon transcriptional antiterminator